MTTETNSGARYGVHVALSSVSDSVEDVAVVRIKAIGARDEANLIRAVQSYARSLADLRAARPTSRAPIDLTPWWRK